MGKKHLLAAAMAVAMITAGSLEAFAMGHGASVLEQTVSNRVIQFESQSISSAHRYGAKSDKLVDGWLYSNGNEGIIRRKPDGTSVQTVTKSQASNFCILDGWIYFSMEQQLRKCRIDGTGETVLYTFDEHQNSYGTCDYLQVVDDWVYFTYNEKWYTTYESGGMGTSQRGSGRSFIKVKTDGSQSKKLASGYDFVMMDGGSIYYDYPDDTTRGVIRTDLDGGNRTLLMDYVTKLQAATRKNGILYFANKAGFYEVKDGQDPHKIAMSNVITRYFDVNSSHLFYFTETGQYVNPNNVWDHATYYGITRVDLSGGNEKLILKDVQLGDFLVSEQRIFYISSKDRCLYQANLDGSGITQLTDTKTYGPWRLAGGYIECQVVQNGMGENIYIKVE